MLKKNITILLVAAILLITGCTRKSENDSQHVVKNEETHSETTSTEETVAASGDILYGDEYVEGSEPTNAQVEMEETEETQATNSELPVSIPHSAGEADVLEPPENSSADIL